jgi:hypothetical protein
VGLEIRKPFNYHSKDIYQYDTQTRSVSAGKNNLIFLKAQKPKLSEVYGMKRILESIDKI